MKLRIAWLYPNLMGTYGDRGNVLALFKRAEWRNLPVEVDEIDLDTDVSTLSSCNLIFMGGAQDRQQKIVAADLLEKKGPIIKELVEQDQPGLFVCASYQFMGRYYRSADGTEIPGLGLFDLHTVNPGAAVPRCIGNIIVDLIPESFGLNSKDSSLRTSNPELRTTLVGFENHGGRTYLGEKAKPLGKVVKGFGNNGKDGTEGAVYKNAIGCYFHGPCLPRNPLLADFLIAKALGLEMQELAPLDDSRELQAHRQALMA